MIDMNCLEMNGNVGNDEQAFLLTILHSSVTMIMSGPAEGSGKIRIPGTFYSAFMVDFFSCLEYFLTTYGEDCDAVKQIIEWMESEMDYFHTEKGFRYQDYRKRFAQMINTYDIPLTKEFIEKTLAKWYVYKVLEGKD